MKFQKLILALIVGLSLFAPSAFAGSPRDLTVKSIFEFPLITPTPVAVAGDYTVRWQGTLRRFIRIDSTAAGTERLGVLTIASGQTSASVTIAGVSATTRCQATQTNLATNTVYIRAAVATTNTITVTISGDPGVSGQTVGLLCAN